MRKGPNLACSCQQSDIYVRFGLQNGAVKRRVCSDNDEAPKDKDEDKDRMASEPKKIVLTGAEKRGAGRWGLHFNSLVY